MISVRELNEKFDHSAADHHPVPLPTAKVETDWHGYCWSTALHRTWKEVHDRTNMQIPNVIAYSVLTWFVTHML